MPKLSFLVLSALLFATNLGAQSSPKRVYITDSGEIYSTYDFSEADMAVLNKQFGKTKAKEIAQYANESAWPEGLRTLDARNENRVKIPEYVVSQAIEFDEKVVLLVARADNLNMPANMQLAHDFYILLSKKGVGETPVAAIPAAEPAPDAEEPPAERVYVLDPGELISNFDIGNNEDAEEMITEYISQEDFEQLALLCHEDQWPAGIATFAARSKGNLEKIKDYFMYFGASFDDEGETVVLAWVPYEENQFMPEDMRPTQETGFYMVFKEKGVKVE